MNSSPSLLMYITALGCAFAECVLWCLEERDFGFRRRSWRKILFRRGGKRVASKSMETKEPSFTILMFPWLAHGHVYPYLELAKNLSTKNFNIFFCSTPNNLNSIRDVLETTYTGVSIHLLELHIPPLPELPPKYHTTKNVPPNLKPKLLEAFDMSKSSFSTIITSLKPDLLIYDCYPMWPALIASSLGIPAVHFATNGAASYSFFYHLVRNKHSPFPYGALHLRDDEINEFESMFKPDEVFYHFRYSSNIILMRTCMGMEGKYVDYLSTMCQKKIVPVGPLIAPSSITDDNHSKFMQWLNTKKQFSTVFVSFGSENYLSKNQITEMAKGLEASNVNFIWVLRFPPNPNVEASMDDTFPEGFLDRVKERGMIIVQGWAPQAAILGHPSIGAFVSHCGMSSIIESAYFGVPVIGIPISIDQPLNAKLLVEIGVGIEVKRGANGHFTSEEVASVLNKVFVLKIGEEMRLKAAELSKKMKRDEEYAISEAIEQLRQVCVEHKTHRI